MVEPTTVFSVAPYLAKLAQKLLKTNAPTRLAKHVRTICKDTYNFPLSKRGLERWLYNSNNWGLLINGRQQRLTIATGIKKDLIRKTRKGRRLTEITAQQRAGILTEHLVNEFLAFLDPSYALAVHDFRTAQLLEKKLDHNPDLSALPPSCWSSVQSLRYVNRDIADNLIQLLTEHKDDFTHIAQVTLATESNHWILNAPHQTWTVLGHYFAAHGATKWTTKAFRKAVDCGATERALLITEAALALSEEDRETAQHLIATVANIPDEHGIVEACRHLFAEKPESVLNTLPEPLTLDAEPNTQLLALILRLVALTHLERTSEAVHLLRKAVEIYPERGMLRLSLAQTLRHYAKSQPIGSIDYTNLLAEAADHAAAAISLLRSWGGPTAQATELSCDLYMATGNLIRVIDIGSLPPWGTATKRDLTIQIQTDVVIALIALGKAQIASVVIDSVHSSEFQQDYLAAALAEQIGQPDPLTLFYKALDAATTSSERALVLMDLAERGATNLPGLEDLHTQSPHWADLIRATAALSNDDPITACDLTRGWQDQSAIHALTYAQALRQAGNTPGAIESLKTAADRFRAAHFAAEAVEMLYNDNQLDIAKDLALRALASYPDDYYGRWRLRCRILDIAENHNDWLTYENHARTLVNEFSKEPAAKWRVIYSFTKRQRHHDAWQQLRSYGKLDIVDESTALIKIDLLTRFDITSEAISEVLDLARRYADSEIVLAQAIQAEYLFTKNRQLPRSIQQRFQELFNQFTEQFPQSTLVQPISININSLIEDLRPYLEPKAIAVDEILDKVRNGGLPYGLVAQYFRCLYATFLVRYGAGFQCSVQIKNQEIETRAAMATLGKEIVLDTSAFLVPATLDRPMWVAEHFGRIQIPDVLGDDALAAVDESMTKESRTLSWDIRSDRPRIHEAKPGELRSFQERAKRLVSLMRQHCDSVSTAEAPPLPRLDRGDYEPWIASIRIARARGLPLYSEDFALRNLARELGVEAFDTYAIIEALEKDGRLTEQETEEYRLDLMRAYIVDLPFDEDRFTTLAIENDFQPGPATLALERPVAWVDFERTFEWFRGVIRQIPSSDKTHLLPRWLFSGSIGAIPNAPIANQRRLLGLLLLSALTESGIRLDNAVDLIDAGRQAVRHLRLDQSLIDPLKETVLVIKEICGGVPPEEVARFTLWLFQSLPEEDRHIVTKTIIAT